jgi:hypothetical protein
VLVLVPSLAVIGPPVQAQSAGMQSARKFAPQAAAATSRVLTRDDWRPVCASLLARSARSLVDPGSGDSIGPHQRILGGLLATNAILLAGETAAGSWAELIEPGRALLEGVLGMPLDPAREARVRARCDVLTDGRRLEAAPEELDRAIALGRSLTQGD